MCIIIVLSYVSAVSIISSTSRRHLCIISGKYFPIALLDREQSENHNDVICYGICIESNSAKQCQRVLAVEVIT